MESKEDKINPQQVLDILLNLHSQKIDAKDVKQKFYEQASIEFMNKINLLEKKLNESENENTLLNDKINI
jgi:hypothetical protein